MARDWAAVRAAYVGGEDAPSLAKRFRIPLATIESKASRGKWGDQRKQVASQVQAGLVGAVVAGTTATAAQQGIGPGVDLAEAQGILAAIARDAKGSPRDRIAALKLAGEWNRWGAHVDVASDHDADLDLIESRGAAVPPDEDPGPLA